MNALLWKDLSLNSKVDIALAKALLSLKRKVLFALFENITLSLGFKATYFIAEAEDVTSKEEVVDGRSASAGSPMGLALSGD